MTPEQFIKERTYLAGVTPATISWYEWSFKAFAGALESKEAIIERIAQLKGRGLSHTSINTYLRCINAYLRWLHLEHHREPLKIPWLKEEQKILQTFSPEQISRIVHWKAHGSRLKALALCALDTGLRVEELLTLTRSTVDLDNLHLRVRGKGNRHRLVPVSLELRKVLFRHLASHQHDLVFCTKDGGKLSQRNLLRDFKSLCRSLNITGVRCSFHSLRHTFACEYLRRGGNLEFLRRILGHASLETTQRYLRSLGIEDLRKVHDGLSLLSR